MPKETYFFTHDYNARNDIKLAALREDYGMEGIGIYWCLIEMLYEEGGYIELEQIENITKVLRTNTTVLRSIIDSILFKKDENYFYSESVLRRLDDRRIKSEKARQSVLKRYERTTDVYERIRPNTKIVKDKIVKDIIQKNTYGEFENVLLTKEEYEKLQLRFNSHLPEMIENLSAGIASKGYKYKSHYATILSWAKKEEKSKPVRANW